MIELIPAIDLINGKCVRLSQGCYESKTTYDVDPVEVAKELESYGLRRIHIVDLDGAASHHIVNYRILEQIASRTSLVIDFGGGVKSESDLNIAFENGAQMVTVGSMAVKDPQQVEKWIEKYGSHRIILGADVKDGHIATNGWKESSAMELLPFIESYAQKGIHKVLCTDIQRDGMLQGPAVELYQSILEKFPEIHLIASGGVSSLHDIHELDEAGVPAVVFGKALYEGKIFLKELSNYIS